MAISLWNDLLHLLKSLWVFLCKICHRRSKRDLTTVLPIASPPSITAQEIVINICAPPEDLLAVDLPSTVNLLNNPCRVKPRCQDEKQQRHTISEFPIPIHVQNWDNPQSKLCNMLKSSSCTLASTVLPSPSVPPALDDHAITSPSLGQDVGDGQQDSTTTPIIESSRDILMVTFEPIKYAPSALSALSECSFLDTPSDDAARMVPLPLYTSTPPRPCSRLSTDQKHTRLSLLPYTDLFDFSMYNSRLSQDTFDQFSFGDLPPDVTTPLAPATEADPTPYPPEIAYRDRYRNPAYSKPTGPYFYKPVSTPVKPVSASNRFSSSDRKHRYLGEISLNSIAFNSPLAKSMSGVSATDICDSSFSTYSQSSVVLSMKSLEDIGTRLHSACDDVSRCIWTDEEFMKLVLE